MLRAVCYFNLIFAVIYFLAYLQNGSFAPVSALLGLVVYSWLLLRGQETGQEKWTLLHWATGLLSLVFAGLTGYGAVVLVLDSIEYQYYPLSVILLSGSGFLFVFTIILQFILGMRNNYSKKSNQPFDN